MHSFASVPRYVRTSALVALLALIACHARAATQPDGTPAAATQPADRLVPVAPAVREVLEKALAAYKGLKTYQDLGNVGTEATVAGRKIVTTMPASTAFKQPDKFLSNYDLLSFYGDGESVWLYAASQERYLQKAKADLAADADPELGRMLRHFPVLWIFLRPDQSLLAIRRAADSAYLGLDKIDGRNCHHVRITGSAWMLLGWAAEADGSSPPVQADLFVDAQTHLLARLVIDMTEPLRQQLADDDSETRVERMIWRFDADQVRLDQSIPDETFAFKKPARAEAVDKVDDLFAGAGPAVNEEELAEREEARQAQLPFDAPDFTLRDLAGKQWKLADLRGKIVLMDFWATWCPPCRAELPHLQKIHEDFAGKGLVVLAVNLAEQPQLVLDFLEKSKYTFTVLLDERNQVGAKYQIQALPTVLLIDRVGRAVKRHLGYEPGGEVELRKEIEELLAAPAPSTTTAPAPSTAPAPAAIGAPAPSTVPAATPAPL